MGPTFLESIFSTGSTGLGPVSCATSCSSSARSSAPRQRMFSVPPWTGQRGPPLFSYMQNQVAMWQSSLQNGLQLSLWQMAELKAALCALS